MFTRLKIAAALVAACAAVLFTTMPVRAAILDVAAQGAGDFYVFSGNTLVLTTGGLVYGPKYQWRNSHREPTVEQDGATVLINSFDAPGTMNVLRFATGVRAGPHSMEWTVTNSAAADYPLTYSALTMQTQEAGAKLTLTPVAGEPVVLSAPLKISRTDEIKELEWEIGGKTYDFAIDPPCSVATDGNARIILVKDMAQRGKQYRAKVTLVGETAFHQTLDTLKPSVDTSAWFAFTPANDLASGAIGMQDWLTLPDHPLKLNGERIEMPSGRAIKLWGTNIEYTANCPPKPDAAKAAAFFAKEGVNAVRMHKLTNPDWEGFGTNKGAGAFDPQKLDRFDYFVSQLRKQKVMYGFSPIWNLRLSPADSGKLEAYSELAALDGGNPATTGFVWFAKDVQDLHIKTMLALLNRTNPYTKLNYLQDPAVAYIELQNEDCVFFYTTMPRVLKSPTYARMLAEQFSDWLQRKYGSQEALVKAWGPGAINGFDQCMPNEQLANRNIYPVANPWMWDNLKDAAKRRRLVDTAAFLFSKQDEYYHRMEAALRSAGYQGPLVAGNWQAGGDLGHFYNLLSDSRIGIIDRHNYMGGTGSWEIHDGSTFSNDTTLGDPGSGMLSTGLQQIGSRPFSVSEWLAVHPQEATAAETVIMAAYGMGLQGWDMSYCFSSNSPGYPHSLFENNTKVFNNETPVNMGLFPILSRMVQRGDVKEAEVLNRRTVSLAQLASGNLPFQQRTTQNGDVKSFSGEPDHSIMAVGRAVIDFTDKPEPAPKFDPSQYREGSTLISTTGQLRWTVEDKHLGWIGINTPGTQGIVGFTPANEQKFADLSLTPQTRYAVVLATAAHPDRKLADDNDILLVAVARAQNTGMLIRGNLVIHKGNGPVLVEPVRVKLRLKRPEMPVVYILDHDGLRTRNTLPVTNGTIDIDTGRDKAIYYEIVYHEH